MKVMVDVPLAPLQLAEAFCEMNDEEQAQFFVEAARICSTWPTYNREMQWLSIGRHLKNCACSDNRAREMVTTIADGITFEKPSHG